MSGAASKTLSAAQLREFYFSGATNFGAFKTRGAGDGGASGSRPSTSGAGAGTPSASLIEDSRVMPTPAPSAATPGTVTKATPASRAAAAPEQSAAAPTPTAAVATKATKTTTAAGSAAQLIKQQQGTVVVTTSTSLTAPSADAVSPEYILFLRQQQDLVKGHQRITACLNDALAAISQQRQAHETDRSANGELLGLAERSTDWHWKSKFNAESLQRDAGLLVPESDLRQADAIPRLTDIQQQHQQLVKLRQDHLAPGTAKAEQNGRYQLVLENAVRRFERLQREFAQSQADAEPLVRISDGLLVQLDHVLSLPPVASVLAGIDDTIAVIRKKHRQCADSREQALEDGEMNVAERDTYRLADLGEQLAAAQVKRIECLRSIDDDLKVSSAVRQQYSDKSLSDAAAYEAYNAGLKGRCEQDLARLYQLKRSVDDTESAMCAKWDADRQSSDDRLSMISRRQQDAWDQIEALLRQIQQLEADRHAEFKKRVEDKVRDESRRNEYQVFNAVTAERSATLDRTIHDCDIALHCAKLMTDLLSSGFATIQGDLDAKSATVSELLFNAQKEHLEIFRSVLFTLGDLEYKKQKKLEEIDASIHAAHIQQELCSDSLNPNAKKFSDAKKELLRVRDDLEAEIRDIVERQNAALEQYEPSESALLDRGFEHVHPREELEDRRLATRAKMVEYKAMSLGTAASAAPIRSELEALKRSVMETTGMLSQSGLKGSVPRASTRSPQ